MSCPICKKDVEPGSRYQPFCSDRCRIIDLGNWASGKYRIPAPAEPASETEEPSDEEQDRSNGAGGR
jgi:endogenous inhibitor of DNA gyrase (YacG/DUF329 family)